MLQYARNYIFCNHLKLQCENLNVNLKMCGVHLFFPDLFWDYANNNVRNPGKGLSWGQGHLFISLVKNTWKGDMIGYF